MGCTEDCDCECGVDNEVFEDDALLGERDAEKVDTVAEDMEKKFRWQTVNVMYFTIFVGSMSFLKDRPKSARLFILEVGDRFIQFVSSAKFRNIWLLVGSSFSN